MAPTPLGPCHCQVFIVRQGADFSLFSLLFLPDRSSPPANGNERWKKAGNSRGFSQFELELVDQGLDLDRDRDLDLDRNSWGHFSLQFYPDFSASDWLRNCRLKHPPQLYGCCRGFSLQFRLMMSGGHEGGGPPVPHSSLTKPRSA